MLTNIFSLYHRYLASLSSLSYQRLKNMKQKVLYQSEHFATTLKLSLIFPKFFTFIIYLLIWPFLNKAKKLSVNFTIKESFRREKKFSGQIEKKTRKKQCKFIQKTFMHFILFYFCNCNTFFLFGYNQTSNQIIKIY